MYPEIKKVEIHGRTETVMNAAAVLELARNAGTPQSRKLLEAFHRAEEIITTLHPYFSQEKITGLAVTLALGEVASLEP